MRSVIKQGKFSFQREQKKERPGRIFVITGILILCLSVLVGTHHFSISVGKNRLSGGLLIGRTKIYKPWQIFIWAEKFSKARGNLAPFSKSFFLMGGISAVGALLVIYGVKRNIKAAAAASGMSNIMGSAKWAERKDIVAAGLLPEKGEFDRGIFAGKWIDPKGKAHYLRDNGKQHVLVFAPTGSGKGVGLVLPTLLGETEMSVVNLDIKGENWGYTAGFRQSLGHKVLRWDPTDAIPGRSAAHNPIEEIRMNTPYEIGDIQNIAGILADPEGKGKNDHWESTGRSLLSGAITHVLYKSKKEGRNGNLADVLAELTKPGQSYEDTMEEWKNYPHALEGQVFYDSAGRERVYLDSDGNEKKSKVHPLVEKVAMEMLNREAAEASSVLSTAVKFLELYSDPVIVSNTNRCDFKMIDIMNYETPVALYLVLNPAYIDRLRPLIRLFLTQMLYALMPEMEIVDGEQKAPYKHRLLLLLDEFPSIGRINAIVNGIAYFRGWNIKTMLITQDLSQLYDKYGKEESITSNCHIQIAYAPNRLETAQYLAEKTGKTTIITEKTSESYSGVGLFRRKNISKQQEEKQRNLLDPSECMQLPGAEKDQEGRVTKPGDMLIFCAGSPAIYGEQILYFKDPLFSERKKKPCPEKSDKLRNG